MAPKWNYFLSFGSVFNTETVSSEWDGAVLSLSSSNTIVACGTPLEWEKPAFVVTLLRQAGQHYRLRLNTGAEGYGFHIDTHLSLFEKALSNTEPFPAE